MTIDMRDRLDRTLNSAHAGGLHAFVVLRNGQILLEHYGVGEDFAWNASLGEIAFGPDTLHDIRSVTKSITALLYGIALNQGLVPGPAEPLLQQFPQYPDLAADPRRARLTVEHALTMSLALEWKEDIPYNSPDNAEIAMEFAPDRCRYVLERPIIGEPGVSWAYCGGATALLGHLIASGTGRTLQEFARETLFGPLGIDNFEWIAGPDGVASAASGLRLSPRDLARLGELVRLEGQGIVAANWIATMLEPRLPTSWGGRYGYQWYVEESSGHPWVAGMGNGGQRLVVVPGLGLVAVIAAGNYDDPEQWRLPAVLLEEVIFPSS